jgi:hypothetical protein
MVAGSNPAKDAELSGVENMLDRFVRKLPDADIAAARVAREWSKGVFDALKNLVLLGALKYFEENTKSPFLTAAFWLGGLFFLIFLMSFIQIWRVRIVSAFLRNWVTELIDFVLNVMGLLAIEIWLIIKVTEVAERLAAVQGH